MAAGPRSFGAVLARRYNALAGEACEETTCRFDPALGFRVQEMVPGGGAGGPVWRTRGASEEEVLLAAARLAAAVRADRAWSAAEEWATALRGAAEAPGAGPGPSQS